MATAQTYTPSTATSQGYTANNAAAVDWNVDGNQLVQNQIGGIIKQDSPLMQQAATAAKQGMAQRGLLNSSMAVGAGQNAVIAQAMPIAQQDASTYANRAQFNANNRTNVNLANANAQNQAAQFGADAANRVGMFNADARNRAGEFNASSQNQFGLTALQQQNELARMAAAQGYNLQTMTEQQKNQLAQMAATQGYNLQTMTEQQKNQLAQMAAAQGYNLQTMSEQQKNELARMTTQQGFTQANTQLQYQLDTAQKVQLANISATAAKELADIEAAYKNLNQASASASSILNTTMNAISQIMRDESLDAAAKQKAIDIYNTNAATSLNLIGSLAGDVDLTDFFDQIGV